METEELGEWLSIQIGVFCGNGSHVLVWWQCMILYFEVFHVKVTINY